MSGVDLLHLVQESLMRKTVYSKAANIMYLVSQKVSGGKAFTMLPGLFHPPKAYGVFHKLCNLAI